VMLGALDLERHLRLLGAKVAQELASGVGVHLARATPALCLVDPLLTQVVHRLRIEPECGDRPLAGLGVFMPAATACRVPIQKIA
jgi:hypothetical protein